MHKVQILFPDPILKQIRRVADAEDKPVSEIVRRATEEWLEKRQFLNEAVGPVIQIPFFKGGAVLVSATDMKELCYDRRREEEMAGE